MRLQIVYYMKTLDKAKKGSWQTIEKVENCTQRQVFRLIELGFIKGQKVKVEAISFSRKVFLLQFRGMLLSVRSQLLQNVQVSDA